MNLQGQQNATWKADPAIHGPVIGVWIVLECGFHVKLSVLVALCWVFNGKSSHMEKLNNQLGFEIAVGQHQLFQDLANMLVNLMMCQ